jgi:hypothetical protein
MQQGSLSFWKFQVAVQTTNALLKNTTHHLDEQKLHEHIEGGMDQVLYVQATNAKCNEIVGLRNWIAEVKQLDDMKHFKRHQAVKAFKQSAVASSTASHTSNSAQETFQATGLSKPSCKVNIASARLNNLFSQKINYPPTLTTEEKSLLFAYNGCFKCQNFFVYHKRSDKVAGCTFPIGTRYKPVTTAMVTASMSADYKLKVTYIMPAITRAGPSTTGHTVAAVFPGMSNPVNYTASNASNVIGGFSDPDSSVSTHLFSPTVATVIKTFDAMVPMVTNVLHDVTAPLVVSHMFWRTSVISSAVADDAPIQFDCFIDNGSHLILICASLAEQLCLHHCKLPLPIETEVVMQEDDKKVILKLYEYVKLYVYDSTAIIALNLISPVILGLPFLSHNSIVIDHSNRTAIDKVQNFDLMHPSVRLPPPFQKRSFVIFSIVSKRIKN